MINKVVNGAAKAVSRIVKRSYNLFDEDKLADAQNGAMSYDKREKTLTITDGYYTDPNLKLKYCAPGLKVGKTYVLTFKTTATRKAIFVRIPGTDGALWNSGQSRTITAYDLNSNIYFYGVKGETCTIKELQIVEGAETKPHVPYLLDVAKVKKVVDGTAVDVFTHVTSEVADGVVEVSPAEVSDGVLTIKGDNVKVENNKLIIQ